MSQYQNKFKPYNSEEKIQSPSGQTTSNPNQSKKNFQWIWKLFFLLFSAVSAVLLNKLYLFQTLQHFQLIKKGNAYQLFGYGIGYGIFFTGLDYLVHYLLDETCQKYYLATDKYITQNQRKNRSYSLVKWSYSLVFYTFTSIYAYLILKNTSYFPWWLGGEGNFYNLLKQIPYLNQATFSMKIFYVIQFGKHLSRAFCHIFIRPQGNYYQYALHHSLSVFLITFSYLMNMWLIGIWVLLIHDVSDFWLILGRGYVDYKHKNKFMVYFIYVFGFIMWVGCRIVLFFYTLVFIPLYTYLSFGRDKLRQNTLQFEVLDIPYLFMAFMLIGLQILHIFWTYYVIQAFLGHSKISKKIKHTYD